MTGLSVSSSSLTGSSSTFWTMVYGCCTRSTIYCWTYSTFSQIETCLKGHICVTDKVKSGRFITCLKRVLLGSVRRVLFLLKPFVLKSTRYNCVLFGLNCRYICDNSCLLKVYFCCHFCMKTYRTIVISSTLTF